MWIAVTTAFALACAGSWWLCRAGARLALVDHPNARSLHDRPMPRSGGLAIWGGIATGGLLVVAIGGARPELAWIAAATAIVGLVSLIDDRSHVPAGLRLLAHAAAAGLLAVGGLGLGGLAIPGWSVELSSAYGGFLALVFIIWMTNLYNFMDGIDGLAGAMAAIGFATLGVLGWLGDDPGYAALCGVVAAAAGGFLVWNFPPARIFMGDSGASVLGLLAAVFALWGDRLGLFPLWIALLVFSPFIVDATVTLARRLLRRERVWEAHRSHYYQRLAQEWGHRRTMLWATALMLACAAAALFAHRAGAGAQWAVIAGVSIVYVAVALAVRRAGLRY